MIIKQESKILLRGFIFLTVTLLVFTYFYRWYGDRGDAFKTTINSDGMGYYAYLPSIFLEHNFGQEQQNQLYHVKTADGHLVNKYTYGTALLESPFFLASYLYASIAGYETDGYSAPFQIGISIAGLFYFLAGLFIFSKLLRKEFLLNPAQRTVMILVMGLATPLTYYAVVMSSFSHVYSFFLINLLLYVFVFYKNENNLNYAIAFIFILGLITVSRPVNILIVLFLPFFFKSGRLFLDFLKEQLKWQRLLALLVTFFIPLFIQMLLWHVQCGKWIFWSYKGEGFYFDHPHFFDFLFSYKKGLFVYCPLFFLIFLSLWVYLRNDRWKLLWSLVFFSGSTYLLSSWYCWYYADSFGMRPVMDFYAVFGIWLAAIFVWTKSIIQRIVYSIILFLFIPLNLIFAHQHYYWIIHPNTMNAEKFWMVFLKTSNDYHYYFGGMDDAPPYAPNGFKTIIKSEFTYNDQPNGYLESSNEWLGGLTHIADQKFCEQEKLWLKVKYAKNNSSPDSGKDLLFVVHATNTLDSTISYYAIKTKEYPKEPTDQWIDYELSVALNNVLQPGDKYGFYFWNKGLEKIRLDSYSIELLTPKP